MTKTSRFGAVVSVGLLSMGLVLAGATSASATDQSYSCGLIRGVWSSYEAYTKEVAGNCGQVGAQARYAHIGGTSWTTWTYDASMAVAVANNTYAGNHWSTQGGTFPS